MSTDDGTKIQTAIKAVCQMHRDVCKLLIDFDGFAPWRCESVFGNVVTDMEKTLCRQPTYWLSDGVYRYLLSKEEPGVVEAITVCFNDENLVEPLLLLGRMQYAVSEGRTITDVCERWDLWNLYFIWNKDWQGRVPKDCSAPDQSRIISARVIAAPLYSVGKRSDVSDLLTRLRNFGGRV